MVIGDTVGATLFPLIPWVMTVYELLSSGWSSVLVRLANPTCDGAVTFLLRVR